MLSGSKLEAAYTVKFTVSSTAVREAMMTERQSSVAPGMGAMVQLRERMAALRKEELAAARPLFTPAQHSRFDENVKAEDADRETQRGRMVVSRRSRCHGSTGASRSALAPFAPFSYRHPWDHGINVAPASNRARLSSRIRCMSSSRTIGSGLVRRAVASWALVALTLSGAAALQAQGATIASATPIRVSLEYLTIEWASLERPLIGVIELTDVQRDAIELLEEKYRNLFKIEAGPIRSARVALLQNSQNFARQDVERALERMAALRKRQLVALRGVLTDAQRVRYDENMKALAMEEEAARTSRERDENFYIP